MGIFEYSNGKIKDKNITPTKKQRECNKEERVELENVFLRMTWKILNYYLKNNIEIELFIEFCMLMFDKKGHQQVAQNIKDFLSYIFSQEGENESDIEIQTVSIEYIEETIQIFNVLVDPSGRGLPKNYNYLMNMRLLSNRSREAVHEHYKHYTYKPVTSNRSKELQKTDLLRVITAAQ